MELRLAYFSFSVTSEEKLVKTASLLMLLNGSLIYVEMRIKILIHHKTNSSVDMDSINS